MWSCTGDLVHDYISKLVTDSGWFGSVLLWRLPCCRLPQLVSDLAFWWPTPGVRFGRHPPSWKDPQIPISRDPRVVWSIWVTENMLVLQDFGAGKGGTTSSWETLGAKHMSFWAEFGLRQKSRLRDWHLDRDRVEDRVE